MKGGPLMKQIILPAIFCVAIVLLTGCPDPMSGGYQVIPVTSDPNGATVTAETGDSVVTPGSFNLLRNQNHTLTAEYPDYELMERQLIHKKGGLFRDELVPGKVHFKFIWLKPTVEEMAEAADANAPGKIIIGYQVKEKETGRFVKIPVYGDQPKEIPTVTKPSPKEELTIYAAGVQRHTWEIGSEVYHFRYKEPGVMEDNGVFYGTVVGYTYRGWVPVSPEESFSEDKGLLRLEGRFASGQVDYEGALSSGTPYEIENIDDYVFETRLLFGIEELDEDWLASLYSGIGYRYLNDDPSFDPYGYERESNYLYVPLGYQLDGSFRNGWSWGTNFEMDILVWGKQYSHMSDIGYLDIDNRQHKGYGLRGTVRLRNKNEKRIILIEPFIRYWNIDDSDISYAGSGYYGIEPANRTTEFGVQVVWKY